jgi:transcription initiation factor TFIID subunit TAF12
MHSSSKIIKSEPMSAKEIKTESAHSMHSKEQQQQQQQQHQQQQQQLMQQQQHQQAMSGHHGMYQRHGMGGIPQQQPSHGISREEELRR